MTTLRSDAHTLKPASAFAATNVQHTPACSSRRHIRAFSLIELVVVIGIVIVLAAIILGVAGALSRKSEGDQTRNTLQLLDMALTEWETAADRQVSYGTPNQPAGAVYDIAEDAPGGSTADHIITQQLLQILNKNSAAKEILARIDTRHLKSVSNPNAPPATTLQVNDPWDTPILTIFPGRKWTGAPFFKDVDGTIRTPFEMAYGECDNGVIFFVSAGPDGEYGDLHLDIDFASLNAAQQADVTRAADNIYSRPPRQDRGVLP